MQVVEPIKVTDAVLISTNVPETDYPAWSNATAYAVGARVIRTNTHKVYEAVAANTNKVPENDLVAAFWLPVSATNRWKAFDAIISDPVVKATSPITYVLKPNAFADTIAFFGLLGSSVRVKITYPLDGVVFDETRELIDSTGITDWWSYFYSPQGIATQELFVGLPLYLDAEIEITISGGSNIQVGEIVVGRTQVLGDTLVNTSIGIEDFSRKERDDFGNAILVPRAFAQTVSFQFTFPTEDARRIQNVLARLRATPAIYSAGAGTSQFGTTIYGFYQDFDIPLTTNVSFGTLAIEGLT